MKYRSIMLIIAAVTVLALAGWRLYDQQQPAATSESAPQAAGQPSTPPMPAAAESLFDKQIYSLTDPASPWVVVNKQRPLQPIDYTPADLADAGGGQRLRAEAAQALSRLRTEARAAGLDIKPLSGYRSYQRQKTVYQSNVDNYGQAEADRSSAQAGYSEHQTGWSIDVGGGGCGIEECFANTAEGQWLAVNAFRYGFIIRYPEGKQAITGYKYEPWHIRYVGTKLSTEMHQHGEVTLEEFFSL